MSEYTPPQQNQDLSDRFYTTFSIDGIGRVRRSCKTNKRKDANEYSLNLFNRLEAEAQALLKDGKAKKAEYTVDEVMGKYYEQVAVHQPSSGTTLAKLNLFNEFFGKHRKWHTLTDKDLSEFGSWRRASYVMAVKNFKDKTKKLTPTNRKIQPATINKEFNLAGTINTFVSKILKAKAADFETAMHQLEIPDYEKAYFEPEQDTKILECLPDYWRYGVRCALLTGVRAQNVFRKSKDKDRVVKRKDLLLEDRIVRFYGKSKKPGGKIIEVPMVDELYNMFVNEMKVEELEPDAPIFVYPEGHRLEGETLGDYRAALHKAMKDAGYQRKFGQGMHMTRHTAATRLVQNDVDLSIIQEILGHSKIETTKGYAHRKQSQRKEAMEKALGKNNLKQQLTS